MAKWGDFETHPVGTTKRIEELEAKLERAVEALQRISLGSQNSMTSKEALGREARATLAELKGKDDDHFTG